MGKRSNTSLCIIFISKLRPPTLTTELAVSGAGSHLKEVPGSKAHLRHLIMYLVCRKLPNTFYWMAGTQVTFRYQETAIVVVNFGKLELPGYVETVKLVIHLETIL